MTSGLLLHVILLYYKLFRVFLCRSSFLSHLRIRNLERNFLSISACSEPGKRSRRRHSVSQSTVSKFRSQLIRICEVVQVVISDIRRPVSSAVIDILEHNFYIQIRFRIYSCGHVLADLGAETCIMSLNNWWR